MFCQKCGKKLIEGAVFCQECGTKVVYTDNAPTASVKTGQVQPVMETAGQSAAGGGTVPYESEKFYGDGIKPYYREQFDRIAAGQKPKFNWAAFFLNGWIQLYNGCTKVFCRTFLPFLIVWFLFILINTMAVVRFNFTLMGIMSVLESIWLLGGLALCIINGLRFNTWYYQDVVANPSKKRSRKGLWIFIACEVVACVVLYMIPFIFAPSYDDILSSLGSDESYGVWDEYMEPLEIDTNWKEENENYQELFDTATDRSPIFQEDSSFHTTTSGYADDDDYMGDISLSNFSYETLYLYGGSYEGVNETFMEVNIYSSFDEGYTVGNVRLYDSMNHETFATMRDDREGEGLYTLCLEDSTILYIKFYSDNAGNYYADILGLDTIYTNVDQIETYIMTGQYIP